MRRVVLTRVATALPLLLATSLVSFVLLHLAPGTFVDGLRFTPGIPARVVDELTTRYGLDETWYRQYGSWLAGVAHGELGVSLGYQRPVRELLSESVPRTLVLALVAHMVSLCVAVPLGLFAASRRNGPWDRALCAAAVSLASIHPVVVGLVGMMVAASTGIVPVGGGSTALIQDGTTELVLDLLRHLLLPAAILTLVMLPALLLQARGAFVDVMPAAFVRAARARGLEEAKLLSREVAPVAMVPLLSYWGSSLGRLLSACFLVEVVTGWPGMGRLALKALGDRDPFLLLGSLFAAAVVLIVGNLLSDLLLARADPRLRLEEASR
ncbi:MAG TPA: ABC transporter permease [Vicinamibacteria bacterium]|nr:ABC transporter permease [Vicinamibacteria bacterium]